MRTTLNIDDDLLAEVRKATGIRQKTRLVRMGLSLLVQQESAKRLITLGGSDRQARSAPRRRSGLEKPA